MPKNAISENAFTKTATGYRFTAKDPIIDFCLFQWHKSGLSTNRMAYLSNLSPSTIKQWDTGKTRRPQHVSVAWFLRALGFEMVARRTRDGTPEEYRVKVLDRPPTPLFKK